MTLVPPSTAAAPGRGVACGAGTDPGAERLSAILARCVFPATGDGTVTMAVSGGPDSMALMVLARAAGLDGTVIHVDHGLRLGSGAEAAVVEEGARKVGFEFSGVRVRVGAGPDLEARARRARYAVLPDGVLTGHTMDDQAETVLLNLIRGAGLDGLSGMRSGPARESVDGRPLGSVGGRAAGSVGGRAAGSAGGGRPVGSARLGVRRPLLAVRRSETAEVCRLAGIIPVADPSNSDPRFRRNRVRAELLPLLDDIAQRDVVPVLARQAALMGDDADLLEELATPVDPTDVAALRAAPRALARRALRAWLRSGEGHHPPSSAELSRVLDVVDGHRKACELSGSRRLWRRAGRLRIEPVSGV